MPNPQQPERRRSEQVPALSPDAVGPELEATKDQRSKLTDQADQAGWPDDRPGGSDDRSRDQDKPDPDEFAERFGVIDDGQGSSTDPAEHRSEGAS